MRGVDSEGQVANFVETEQIVQYEGHHCSFVQVRVRLFSPVPDGAGEEVREKESLHLCADESNNSQVSLEVTLKWIF